MAKVKRAAPTSIRLSPDITAYVESLQRATGWSASKVFEHMVLMWKATHDTGPAGVRLITHLLTTAVESKKQIDKAEAIAAAAKSNVRKAAAAVKEIK